MGVLSSSYFIFILTYNHYFFTHYTDFTSRYLLTDFVINKFFLFWTNFFYLYIFIFFIILLLTLLYSQKGYTTVSLLFFFTSTFIGLYSFITLYWSLNVNFCCINITSSYFNNLLANSVNKYHPLLFYLSLLPLLKYLFLIRIHFYNNTLFILNKVTKLLQHSYVFLFINIITLYLGSWWALQEGSWGGWWNWDPSEVFGLIILYGLVFTFHFKSTYPFFINNIVVLFIVFTVLITYFTVQLNFNLVSHNFGTRTNWFYINDFIYLFFLYLYILMFFLIIYIMYRFITTLTTISKNFSFYYSKKNLFLLILFVFIVTELFYSFNPLLSNLFLNLNQYIIFTNLGEMNINYIILFIILLFLYFSFGYNSCFILLNCYYSSWLLLSSSLVIVILVQNNFLLSFSHLLLLIFIILSSNSFMTYQNLFNPTVLNPTYVSLYTNFYENFNYNNLRYLQVNCNLFSNSMNNFSVLMQNFTFESTINFSKQVLVSTSLVFNYSILVLDYTTHNLNTIFLIFIILSLYVLSIKKLIIF